jgi:DNA-binding transcriptional LysR family regulator
VSLQSFDLNLLITFDTLLETRSVSRTAERLSLTQPAVSNALRRLREQLDDPILVRSGQGMEPTPKALTLVAPIKHALRDLESALLPTQPFDSRHSQRQFVIAAPDFIGVELVSRLLPGWQSDAPGVGVTIRHLQRQSVLGGLEKGDIDLAIGRFFDVPSRFQRHTWKRDHLVCLVAEDHPLQREPVSLQRFLEQTHVWVSNSGRRGMVDHWLEEQNCRRQIVATLSTYTAGALLVGESRHVMVVAKSYAEYFCRQLPLRSIPLGFDPGSFSIDLLWHPIVSGDKGHRWLLDEILER